MQQETNCGINVQGKSQLGMDFFQTQHTFRQTLDSERDAIIERRSKLLEELAALDEKLECTEGRIRTVVSEEESIAKKVG